MCAQTSPRSSVATLLSQLSARSLIVAGVHQQKRKRHFQKSAAAFEYFGNASTLQLRQHMVPRPQDPRHRTLGPLSDALGIRHRRPSRRRSGQRLLHLRLGRLVRGLATVLRPSPSGLGFWNRRADLRIRIEPHVRFVQTFGLWPLLATLVVDFVGDVLEGGVGAAGGLWGGRWSPLRFDDMRGHAAFYVAEAGVAVLLGPGGTGRHYISFDLGPAGGC